MGIVIDVAVQSGERLDFMGKPAWTSTNAAAMAIKAGALYMPYFSMRAPDRNSFRVEIAAPIPHSDPTTMTLAAHRLLEERITADPGNWFWVHRRWKPEV